jgi:hypothetical protein
LRAPGSAPPPAPHWLGLWLAVEALALLALGTGGDPTARPLRTLALLAAATVALCLAVRAARRAPPRLAVVLLAAAILRLVLVPLPPALSSDVWRYLWDGRVAAAGANPYLLAPADPTLEPLRDAGWERVHHREVPTVYPPVAIALWSLVARLPSAAELPVWKLLVVAADLLACLLLVRLGSAARMPGHRALWYAANPLVALEVAGMGHVEPLGVAAAVGAVLALARAPARPRGAAWAAAVAGLVKIGPFAALPMWARQSGRPLRFLVAAGVAAGLALLPVAGRAGLVPPGLATYAVRWEFAGPLHEPLWRALAAARVPEAVEHGLDLTKLWTGVHAPLNLLYPWAYPQLLSRLLLGIAAVAVVLRSLAWRDPVGGTSALFGALLLCSPTVYPWYLLWVLPWAALQGQRRWLWVVGVAPLMYVPDLLGLPWWPWLHLVTWTPFPFLWWLDRRCAGA